MNDRTLEDSSPITTGETAPRLEVMEGTAAHTESVLTREGVRQREDRYAAIKKIIGIEAYTSLYLYCSEHPMSSIPDFEAVLERWKSKQPKEIADRIPDYNKRKWERHMGVFTKQDIEELFGIRFAPRKPVKQKMMRAHRGSMSEAWKEKQGLLDSYRLESRIGSTLFGYIILLISPRESEFLFTVEENSGKKIVTFVSPCGTTIDFSEVIDFVTCLRVASFPHNTTKKLLVHPDNEPVPLEINLEKVIRGWMSLPEDVLKKYRRTPDGGEQLRFDMDSGT